MAPKHITKGEVYRAASPYVIVGLLMLVIVMLLPSLATWLPRVLLGK